MRRAWFAVLAVLLILAALGASPVSADDHRVPRVVLRTGGDSQRGMEGTTTWAGSSEPGLCWVGHGDAIWDFPRALEVRAGVVGARVVIWKRHRPEHLSFRWWPRVDRNEVPRGRGIEVVYELHPRRQDGKIVAWVARLELTVRRHVYLQMTGAWDDREGCGVQQEAEWRFHLRAG
jgi:hypothetical protein